MTCPKTYSRKAIPKLASAVAIALIVLQAHSFGQTYTIAPPPFLTVLDNSAHVVVNGCVWTYAAGTTTAIATYADNAGTLNANPIIADNNGRFTVYLLPGTNYKFVYENVPCNSGLHGATLRTADNIAGVPAAAATVDISTALAGETISAGQCAYLSDGSGGKNSGQWYKCDSANTYSATTPEIGIATAAITSGSIGTVRQAGAVSGLSSLSVGAEYFVGTAGALTSTAPANKRHVGHADSATTLVLSGNPQPILATPITVPNGGTGLSTTPTNGQLPIGNGSGYTLAALTAGSGVTVTNGAGSITVAPNSRVLDRSTTEQDVTNTGTETSVYSFSVPGGTLGTANVIRLTLNGMIDMSVSSVTLTARVKFGGTTIAQGNIAATAATKGGYRFDVLLVANGATNSQRATILYDAVADSGSITDGTLGVRNGNLITQQTALAIDSTANQTLTVTMQWASASATAHVKRWAAITELLQP